MANIKKAIIVITDEEGGLFPLNCSVPRELLPLGEIPTIHRIVDEIVDCKVEEIIFTLSSSKKKVAEYFDNFIKSSEIEEVVKRKYSSIKFSTLSQKKAENIGNLIVKTKERIEDDAFMVSSSDVIFDGKKSSLEQLFLVYRTSKKQVIALKEVDDDNVFGSYIVKTEKIANRFYKIKKIEKEVSCEMNESRLAVAGRYIFTPAIFNYLKDSKSKNSIIDAINDMIAAGKTVYGHVSEGDWFPLKEKENYLDAQYFFLNKRK